MSEDRCPVCARPAHASTMIDATCLTASQLSALRRAHPEAAPIKEACRSCAVESRGAALADLAAAAGWYSPNAAAAADVAEALRDGSLITAGSTADGDAPGSLAHRLSACVISQLGRWRYVSLLVAGILIWLAYNQYAPLFLPHPQMMLMLAGLALTMLASLQGPVILMAQMRHQRIDRLRAIVDYRINLKAELEISDVSQRTDILIVQQQVLARRLERIESLLAMMVPGAPKIMPDERTS